MWDLAGEEIVGVQWRGIAGAGLDPTFAFGSGGQLHVTSDAGVDTWVLRTPSLVLVGPLVE